MKLFCFLTFLAALVVLYYVVRIHKIQKASINKAGTSVSKLRKFNKDFEDKLKEYKEQF